MRTKAPIFSSCRRMVPQVAWATWVWATPRRRSAQRSTWGHRGQPQPQLIGPHRLRRRTIGPRVRPLLVGQRTSSQVELALLDPAARIGAAVPRACRRASPAPDRGAAGRGQSVLVAEGDAEYALTDQRRHRVLHVLRRAAVREARGEPVDQPDRPIGRPKKNSAPAPAVKRPPSKAATTRRPSTLPKSNRPDYTPSASGDLHRTG